VNIQVFKTLQLRTLLLWYIDPFRWRHYIIWKHFATNIQWKSEIFQSRAAELSCNRFSLYSGFETYRCPLAWESCCCCCELNNIIMWLQMKYYLLVYGALSVASLLLSLLSSGVGQYAGARARRVLHKNMLLNVIRCPLPFFECTPVGRIINRFSTDTSVIDKVSKLCF